MKYIVVIGDGMADNPVKELLGKTPLEAAHIPVMDALAKGGEVGRVQTVPPGLPPGSDTAILSIFGYDPCHYYTGRAPLEAAAGGVALQEGDVAYRCNMVAFSDDEGPLEQKTILSHSGGSIDGESSQKLLEALLQNEAFAACAKRYGAQFYPANSFRHIVVQKGGDADGLQTAPPHDHLGEAVGANLPRGSEAAAGLCEMMRLAHDILDGHELNRQRRQAGKLPANGIWFWAEGRAVALPNFEEQHGKKGFAVSAVPLVNGIAALAGMPAIQVPGATGELDTDFEGKADAVLHQLLQPGCDVAVLHVEAPDECTHDGDLAGKLQAIEWLDARTLGRLTKGLKESGEDWRMLVLSDHKTLIENGRHDGDPVPYILYDSCGTMAKSGLAYSEAAAESGPFESVGHTLLSRLLEER